MPTLTFHPLDVGRTIRSGSCRRELSLAAKARRTLLRLQQLLLQPLRMQRKMMQITTRSAQGVCGPVRSNAARADRTRASQTSSRTKQKASRERKQEYIAELEAKVRTYEQGDGERASFFQVRTACLNGPGPFSETKHVLQPMPAGTGKALLGGTRRLEERE